MCRRCPFLTKHKHKTLSDRQTLKSGKYPKVEDVLYTWFLQECNTPSYFSGNYSCEGKIFLQNDHEKKMISKQAMDG
jgi:hypothetical protein